MAKQELEEAKKLTSGLVYFNLNNLQSDKDKAHVVINLKTTTLSESNSWALVQAIVESVNPQNTISVHWYNLTLLKEDIWKIYKLEEIDPLFAPGRIEDKDVQEGEDIFAEFSRTLLEKHYQEAGTFLIGKAKNSHEQAATFLEDTVIAESKQVKINSAIALSGSENNLILRLDYQLDGRDLSVIVSYYRTSKGWKIYNVSQI